MSKLVPVRVRLAKAVAPAAQTAMNRFRPKTRPQGVHAVSKVYSRTTGLPAVTPVLGYDSPVKVTVARQVIVFMVLKEMRFYE